MNASAAVSTANDEARAQLRTKHEVRHVTPDEEGCALDKLPPGVYGFTFAPATETPLFAKHSYHSFEVHKLRDGSSRLIGYCSAEDAAKLDRGGELFEIAFFPDVWESAAILVSVPVHWLLTDLYRPIRYDGNARTLRLSTS